MNDPIDNSKNMQRDTLNEMLTQRPDEKIVLAGRYHIVRKLGEGGMGSVWLAEDIKLDNRQIAIKMLPVVLVANKRAIQQLKAEAKVAIKLAHPNIATLRSFEESEQGPFLVMDFIPGRTLEDILAEKKSLPEEEVLRIFRPVAEAIDYAHSEKVIHRDIKPSNILIRDDGTPFIMDFGIAREIKDTMTRLTGRSASGTLPYMSPEQLRGETPTPAQDIYSLAATMYECISSHPPFHRGQIEYQIVNCEPESLHSECILCKRVMEGLSKEPSQRPDNAKMFFQAPEIVIPAKLSRKFEEPVIPLSPASRKISQPSKPLSQEKPTNAVPDAYKYLKPEKSTEAVPDAYPYIGSAVENIKNKPIVEPVGTFSPPRWIRIYLGTISILGALFALFIVLGYIISDW